MGSYFPAGREGNRSRGTIKRAAKGFTLIELLVVLAIIGILAALLLPTLTKGNQRAQGVVCLYEGKQMMIAMTLYTADYHDYFPPNPDDGNSLPGHNWCSGKAGGGGADEFNPDVLKDPARSLLVSYLNGNVAVFHCPGGTRVGLYQGEISPHFDSRIASQHCDRSAGLLTRRVGEAWPIRAGSETGVPVPGKAPALMGERVLAERAAMLELRG